MDTSTLFSQIFNTVFPLASIVLVAFFYARVRPTDMAVANRINISVFCPALIFSVMASKEFHIAQYLDLILAAAVVVLGSGLVVLPFCKWLKISPKTFIPPMMFNNSGNLGIPLIVLAFGESALPIAVVLFLTENLLHFTVGMYLLNPKSNPLNVLKMPMIIATMLGLVWSFQGWTLAPAVKVSVDMLGQIAIPLMLFALGVRMTSVDFGQWRLGVISGVLCPLSGLIVAVIWQYFVGMSAQNFAYLLIFACLPPAVLNYMVAELYQQEPHKVASIVLISNIMSIAIIPCVLFYVL
ncbi:AEC family transporter [Marinomonas hwangdonensis]|uniref:AEC family transporter n=1 Tax=Marinomonas hwangdonensis TaxID=1053647 RepID=A0A3M8PVH7_9GAMM|nr:AEC family transporter [Marinomonas hwangdonensis]RNF47923.1 AEC family transporter [Marinomonas hwangdonensis]